MSDLFSDVSYILIRLGYSKFSIGGLVCSETYNLVATLLPTYFCVSEIYNAATIFLWPTPSKIQRKPWARRKNVSIAMQVGTRRDSLQEYEAVKYQEVPSFPTTPLTNP